MSFQGIDMGYCFYTQDGGLDELSVLVLKDTGSGAIQQLTIVKCGVVVASSSELTENQESGQWQKVHPCRNVQYKVLKQC